MEAKELRLGNLVFAYEDGKRVPIEINGYHLDTYQQNNNKWYTKLEPIPLDEGWLIKLGFERKTRLTKIIEIELTYYEFNSHRVWLIGENKEKFEFEFRGIDGNLCNLFCVGSKERKYVHQLQNLYFALTGKELQTK